MKIYTYETDLYKELNNANCRHDQSKIKTLGPYSMMLSLSLQHPPLKNADYRKEIHTGEKKYSDGTFKIMTLYRGLGLPQSAIDYYIQLIGTNTQIIFNGFTSTSVDRNVAIGFAIDNTEHPKIPVLLELTVADDGKHFAFLKNDEYSAFPEEQEVLIGGIGLVKKVTTVDGQNGMPLIKL